VAGTDDKLDKLEADLGTYVAKELRRVDREVAFLKRVREGRGLGAVKKMSEDFVEGKLVTKVNDFLAK
jgi:hypothetical protein